MFIAGRLSTLRVVISKYDREDVATVFLTANEEIDCEIQERIQEIKRRFNGVAIFISGNIPAKKIIQKISGMQNNSINF